MNKPTDEQIKEFYVKILDGKVEFGTIVNGEIVCYRRTTWDKEDEEWNIEVIPRTDSLEYLGWLFKYAVPKLQDMGYQIDIVCFEHKGFDVCIFNVIQDIKDHKLHRDDDLTLVLFWAIYEVLGGKG